MTDNTPESSLERSLDLLRRQATERWGADYVNENAELLELAASYIVNIGANRPETETEPGFFQ